MSPRTRRRPTGRVERTVRQAGRDLGTAVRTAPGATGRAVVNHATKVQCPWCETRPWIPRSRWEDHAKAHTTADDRKTRNGQRIDVQRRQQARQAEGERERASRPVNHQARAGHGPAARPTSPRVRWVDDDGNRIDWSPGQPLPPNTTGYTPPGANPELNRPNRDLGRVGVAASVTALLASLMTALGRALLAALRGLRDGAGSRRSRVGWINLTPRPASPDPDPEPAPATPTPAPDDPDPAVVVPIRGGPMPPRTRTPASGTSKKKTPAASGGTPASASGASGIGDAAMQWARATPETLVLARFDAQHISEALAELANALRLRANLETDRGISPHCVEPYEEAAAKMLAAADDCQEVHARLLARYSATAEDLARPDTPDADYLKEGV